MHNKGIQKKPICKKMYKFAFSSVDCVLITALQTVKTPSTLKNRDLRAGSLVVRLSGKWLNRRVHFTLHITHQTHHTEHFALNTSHIHSTLHFRHQTVYLILHTEHCTLFTHNW